MRWLLLVLSVMLSSCTPLQPMGLHWDIASDCENVECVVERVDQAQPEKGQRYIWMEGYRDVPLSYMYEHGTLKIKLMDPFSMALGIYGMAEIYQGVYGDVATCTVLYTPSPAWRVLVHELSHCKGYPDRFPVVHWGSYTPAQKKIMSEEGVGRWVDTEFYKNDEYLKEYSNHELYDVIRKPAPTLE